MVKMLILAKTWGMGGWVSLCIIFCTYLHV